ncbi:MAG: phage antirepressor KilAC domain-containing protein [Actinomycetales bacterium]
MEVRTRMVDGEPWFVVADVARVLALSNPTMAVQSIDPDDLSTTEVIDSLGRPQNARVANESALYQLIFQSRKTEARAFKRWVTHEVLPAIRKTGSYSVQRELSEAEVVLQALTILKTKTEAQAAEISVLAPKASAWDAIVSSAGSWSYQDAAHALYEQKSIVIGQKRLVSVLLEWGWMYRDHKGRPHAYQRVLEQGLLTEKIRTYVDTVTGETLQSSAPQVRITGKGLDVIYRRLSASSEAVSA